MSVKLGDLSESKCLEHFVPGMWRLRPANLLRCHTSLTPSFSVCLCLPVSLFVFVLVCHWQCLSMFVYISLPPSISVCPCLFLSVGVGISPSIVLCLFVFLWLY